MGLDMYLRAEEYVPRKDWLIDNPVENELFHEIVSKFDCADVIDTDGFAGITIALPMGYWRKANQIHAWFVQECGNGVDECQNMFVGRDKIEQLRDLCVEVLADHSKAEELLSPQAGFFFGSYEIDEWYFEQLEYTVEILNRCLSSKFDYFEYQASW